MSRDRNKGRAEKKSDADPKWRSQTAQTPANEQEWFAALGLPRADLQVQTPRTDEEWERIEAGHGPEEQPPEKGPKKKDVQVGTEPRQPRPMVDAQVDTGPLQIPLRPRSNDRERSSEYRDADSLKSRSSVRVLSSTEEYDIEEHDQITTKVIKVLKKRPTKKPLYDDSDDAYDDPPRSLHEVLSDDATATINLETDVPQTDISDFIKPTDSSSLMFTSSESLNLDSTDYSIDDALYERFGLPHNHNLGSALAFIYMVIPPDGGYGWIIMVVSFLAQLIVDGIVFSIGILLPYMSEEFAVAKSQIVLVASIQMGCYFLGGALSSALINSYGFRPVALSGVILSALAMLAASFSPNLATVIIAYGIIAGPCLSMIWVSSQLIIGYYFERYRPIANGFSCSGAGAGIVLFSFLNVWLTDKIGWRNTMRIHILLLLLVFFMGLAYVEVTPSPVGIVHKSESMASSSEEYYGDFYVHNFMREDITSKKSYVFDPYVEAKPRNRFQSLRRCAPCCNKRHRDSMTHSKASMRSGKEKGYVIRADPMQREDLFYTGPAEYEERHSKENIDGKEMELVGTTKNMQSAAYGLKKIREHDSSYSDEDNLPRYITQPAQQVPRGSRSPNSTTRRHKHKKHHWLRTKIMRAFNRLFDFHLFKQFEFRVLVASAFFYPMGFNIPFVYSKARAEIPPEYSILIGPCIGATNFMVRCMCGFVAFKLRSATNNICGGGMIFGGFFVFLSSMYGADKIWFQILYGMCYGVAPAVYSTLRALIYVRYLGLSKLTNVFGITSLAMGLGVFIGTSLGGFLIDQTGTYNYAFAFAGMCIMIAGGLKLVLPMLIRLRQNRNQT